jgi:Pyruvate/2-oxoacid:ferredoxin oxidoreductase delta subunit
MTNPGDSYNQLADRWGAPGSTRFVTILKALMTPEEGDLLLEIPALTTCQDLASKLKTGESGLRVKLDDLTKRNLLRFNKVGYVPMPNIMSLCHQARVAADLQPKFDEMWTDFFFAEWRFIIADQQYQRRLAGKWSVHRILPALQALAASPNLHADQILWYENLEAMFRRSKLIVYAPCGCKRQHKKCDNKVNTCLHVILDDDTTTSASRWANLKPYTVDEALVELYAAEDAGLVHLSLNHPRLEETCNCCECCCRVINPLIYAGKDYDLMDPSKSRFIAVIDEEKCAGCQTCIERCNFNAIEMRKPPDSKKLKAYVMDKFCMGCGLCVYKCPNKAMRLEIIRPPDYIPNISREQSLSWGPGF